MSENQWAETAAKYGEDRWWESSDARERAYRQLHEPVLMYDFHTFHGDLEALLERPVWTHEMGLCWEDLQREAEAARRGTPYSDEGKEAAITAGFEALERTDKPIIRVSLDEGDPA